MTKSTDDGDALVHQPAFYTFSPQEYLNVTEKERLSKTTIPIRIFLVRFKGGAKSSWSFPAAFPPMGTPDGSITYSAAYIYIPAGEAVVPHGPRSRYFNVQISSLGGPLFSGLVATMSNSEDRLKPKDTRVINVFVQHSATVDEELLTYHLNVPDETGGTLSAFTGFLNSYVKVPYDDLSDDRKARAGILVIAYNEGFPLPIDRTTRQIGILGGKISVPRQDWNGMKEEEAELEKQRADESRNGSAEKCEEWMSDALAVPIETKKDPTAQFTAENHQLSHLLQQNTSTRAGSVQAPNMIGNVLHPNAGFGPLHFPTGNRHTASGELPVGYESGSDLSHDLFPLAPALPQNIYDGVNRLRQGSAPSTSDTDLYASEADSTTYQISQLGRHWMNTEVALPDHHTGMMGQAHTGITPDFNFHVHPSQTTNVNHSIHAPNHHSTNYPSSGLSMMAPGGFPFTPHVQTIQKTNRFGGNNSSYATTSSGALPDQSWRNAGVVGSSTGVFSMFPDVDTKLGMKHTKRITGPGKARPRIPETPRPIVIIEGRLAAIPEGTGIIETINWEVAFGRNKLDYLRSAALEHARNFHAVTYLLQYRKRVKVDKSSAGAAWKECFPSVLLERGTVAQKVKCFFSSFREDVVSKSTMLVTSAPDYTPYVCTNPYAGVPGAGFLLPPTTLVRILTEAITIRCATERYPYPGLGDTNINAANKIIKIYEALREVYSEEELNRWMRDDPDYNALTYSNRPDSESWKTLVIEVKLAQQRGGKKEVTWDEDDEEEDAEDEDEGDDDYHQTVGEGKVLRAGLPKWAVVLRYLVPDMVSDDDGRKKQSKKAGRGKARRV